MKHVKEKHVETFSSSKFFFHVLIFTYFDKNLNKCESESLYVCECMQYECACACLIMSGCV